MSGRRASATLLVLCALLAFTASAAAAQTSGDTPYGRMVAPTISSVVAPAGSSLSLDLGSLRLGLPLQLGVSLAAYRWLEPAMSRMDARRIHDGMFARQEAVLSSWWRKRF